MLALFKQESAVPVGCRSPARLLAGEGDDAFFSPSCWRQLRPLAAGTRSKSAAHAGLTIRIFVMCAPRFKLRMKWPGVAFDPAPASAAPRSALDPSHLTLRSGPKRVWHAVLQKYASPPSGNETGLDGCCPSGSP